MTGSILQLAATGIDTIYLTGNPTITHFKVVYRRHTEFTLYPITEKVQNFTKFNSYGRYKLPKKGDCIKEVYLQFEISKFNVIYEKSTKQNITKVLNDYNIFTWINNYTNDFIITPDIYNNIKPYIYDAIESYVSDNNSFLRFKKDIERGINFYHENNDNIINSILKKINKLYSQTSFFPDKDYVYFLLDKLKKYMIDLLGNNIQNYIDNFEYVNNKIITDASSGDVCGNIIDVTNEAFVDISDNIIYQGDYIDWLYNFGYGLYSLDSNGNYIRDGSGNRVEKAYKLDSSGNYKYDDNNNKIPLPSNLTDNTKLLSAMFDILNCYYADLKSVNLDMQDVKFDQPLTVRDVLYDLYLHDQIFDKCPMPFATVGNDNYYYEGYVYILLTLLVESAANTPTIINFLDKKIGDYYDSYLNDIYNNSNYTNLFYHNTDVSGTYYKRFSSYIILLRFLETLKDDIIYNEQSITDVRPYLIQSIQDNLTTNYIMFDIIGTIVSSYQFINDNITNPHIRFGTYTMYTMYNHNYVYTNGLTNTISPLIFGLSDGLKDLILNDGDLVTNNYSTCFFREDILNYAINNYTATYTNGFANSLVDPYLNDKSLWDFLLITQEPMKSLLQDISFNGISVYTILTNELNKNVINKLALMNLLPIYLIYEIPLAVNHLLSVEYKEYFIPANTPFILSSGDRAILDLSNNTYHSSSFNKAQLYNQVLNNILLDASGSPPAFDSSGVYIAGSGTYVVDSDFINAFANAYLVDDNKFTHFRVVRPERKFSVDISGLTYGEHDASGKQYFIPNTRAIIETYRKEYYHLIFNNISATTEQKETIFAVIDMMLNSYIAFDNPNMNKTKIKVYTNNSYKYITPINYLSYDYYTYNNYNFLPLEYILNSSNTKYSEDIGINSILPSNSVTLFKYAQTSYYGYAEKYNISVFNKLFNNQLLNYQYYNDTLGLTMTDVNNSLKQFIKQLDLSTYQTIYFTAEKTIPIDGKIHLIEFDTSNNVYPSINFTYCNDLNNPYYGTQNYSIYNNDVSGTETNINIPTTNGFNYNDFQNLFIDCSLNSITYNHININQAVNYFFNPPNGNTFRYTISQVSAGYNAYYENVKKLLDMYRIISVPYTFDTTDDLITYYGHHDYSGNYYTNQILYNSQTPSYPPYGGYLLVGNMLYNVIPKSYTTDVSNILYWSFKDLFIKFDASSNPFVQNTLLHECYTIYHNKYANNELSNEYSKLTKDIVNNYIYNNKYKYTQIYNNFSDKYNLFCFLKKFLIENTDGHSDANYLLRFNDPTISKYEYNILTYLTNQQTKYFNIVTKILKPVNVGQFTLDTEIDYINQRLKPYFSIQQYFINNNTFEESELDLILRSMVNNLPANYSWVNELGHYICEYINLEVNKDVIDSYNSQLFTLERKLYGEATQLRGYDYLIGNRKELFTYDNKDKSNIKITIPLRFWFCKDIYNSLPMTNILYSDVEICFKVRELLDLLQIAPYSFIDKTPRFRCNVLVNYIYIEAQERLRIAASKLEFLVETNQSSGIQVFTPKDIVNSKIKSKLYFSGPSKLLLWRARIMKNGKKAILINIDNKITIVDDDKTNWNINGCQLYTPYVKQVFIPTTKQYVNLIYKNLNEIKIIKSTDILFNGNVRQGGDSEYYNCVTPYDSNLGYLDNSEFMYSFALFPKLTQPSGAANLSMIEDLTIEHTLTSDIINYITSNNLELEIEYFTKTYQIMRVMSGFIAPAFIYAK